jgi:hypothetical protein
MRTNRGMGSRFVFTAMLVGCGADPSTLLDGRGVDARRSVNGTEPDADASAPALGSLAGGAADDAGASPSDGGTGMRGDAQADAASADGAAAVTAFTGAGAFVATTGSSARMTAHAFAGNTPITNPAKQACLGCHVAGGAAKAFAFAGTAFNDVAGTIPAVGVEVRVRAADGTAVSAFTDEDGNFYQAAPIAFPANVGVRSATSSHTMMGLPPDGGCNNAQCHDGNAHPWVSLP